MSRARDSQGRGGPWGHLLGYNKGAVREGGGTEGHADPGQPGKGWWVFEDVCGRQHASRGLSIGSGGLVGNLGSRGGAGRGGEMAPWAEGCLDAEAEPEKVKGG